MPALAQYAPLLPELILAVGAMTLLMLGVFRPDTSIVATQIMWLAIIVMVAAIIAVALGAGRIDLFDGAFIVDPFARFMKILVLVGAIGAVILSFDEMSERKALKFEYPVLILLSATGMMMMVSASDLISLYLGLELQSLALYVVAAFRRDSTRSSEAGLKYFVLGALSSGMLLYGASLLYGFAGSTSFAAIADATNAAGAGQNLLLVFGLVFLLAGVAFKISAAPFHMWTPDVYEGAPTPVTAFFSSAPKVAAMALFIRVVISMFAGVQPQWQQIVVFLAVASMLLGAFAAIRQTNIKRLMAYSSIANMGYALVGLAAGTVEGVAGRSHLYRDLRRHDARHLRLHPLHAPRGRGDRGYQRARRALADRTCRWRSRSPCSCSRWPASRRSPASSASCSSSRPQSKLSSIRLPSSAS